MQGDSLVRRTSRRGIGDGPHRARLPVGNRIPIGTGPERPATGAHGQQRPMRIDLGVVRWAQEGKAGIEFIRMAGDDQLRLRFLWVMLKRERGQVPVGGKRRCVWAFRECLSSHMQDSLYAPVLEGANGDS